MLLETWIIVILIFSIAVNLVQLDLNRSLCCSLIFSSPATIETYVVSTCFNMNTEIQTVVTQIKPTESLFKIYKHFTFLRQSFENELVKLTSIVIT